MSAPRVTYHATPVVWIHIRGEKKDTNSSRVRSDGGLVTRFLEWCLSNEVYTAPEVRAGYSGGGGHAAAYHVEDAERAIAWLRENGAEEEES